LTPAVPETVLMPFSFESLYRAVTGGGGLELELDWDDSKSRRVLRLDPAVLLESLRSSIRLLGWTSPGGGGQDAAPAAVADIYGPDDEPHPLANLHPLPVAAGMTLMGEWEVPGWLSGFTLRLDVDGAPGEYRLDSVPVDGSAIVLCTDCRKGDRIQLVVSTSGAWTRFPGASIVDAAAPSDATGNSAIEWLRLLDEKGSRKYREKAAAEAATSG